MGDFYGTGIEIWAGFGPIGSTKKRGLGRLSGCFFHVFRVKTNLKLKKKNIFFLIFFITIICYRIRNIASCSNRHLTAGLIYNDFESDNDRSKSRVSTEGKTLRLIFSKPVKY